MTVRQELAPYEAVQASDFRQEARTLVSQLTRNRERVGFGPVYHVYSKGKALSVHALTIGYIALGQPLDNVILLAQDEFDSVVGDKHAGIVNTQVPPVIIGKIETARRNQGLAIPIELAFDHFMRSLSSRAQTTIVEHGSNGNVSQLLKLRAEQREFTFMTGKIDYETEELIKRGVEEQDRWQHMYGPHGILGFSATLLKTYPPLDYDPTGLSSVVLQRIDREENGRLLAGYEVVATKKDDEVAVAIERQEHFEKELLPQLRLLAA